MARREPEGPPRAGRVGVKLAPLSHPEDVRDLTIAQRRAVVQALRDLAEGRATGKVLAPAAPHQRFRARLAGLRTLPVYTSAITVPDRYVEACRIVYRVTSGAVIDVVAIGPRQGSAVYKTAAERLNPRRPRRRIRRR